MINKINGLRNVQGGLISALCFSLLGAMALPATAQSTQQQTSTTIATANDAKPFDELQRAAQRLREAVQAMAQAPAGEQRNQAIHDANRALLEVNSAMANLPPSVLSAKMDENHYKQSMDLLKQSAQRLRDAAQALAQQPVGERRNETIKSINQALIETQQVMIDVSMANAGSGKK